MGTAHRYPETGVLYRVLDRELPLAVRGSGCWLFDEGGRRYLDACGGAFVASLGHGVSEVADAAAEQQTGGGGEQQQEGQRRRHESPYLSPRSVRILGSSSSEARIVWQASQLCVMVAPLADSWVSSWQRKQPL